MRPAQLLEPRPRRLQWTIPAIVSPKLQFPRLSQSIPMPDTLPSLSQNRPANLYNGMIAPLLPYAIRGSIWYQGESNCTRAHQYRTLFPAMIENWRKDFGRAEMPFLFVQLAPFRYTRNDPALCAELWEAQLLTLKNVKNTGMAVTTDIGNIADIHPTNKLDVGRRLSLWALAKTYGHKDVIYSGPIYQAHKIDGDKVVIEFDASLTGSAEMIFASNRPSCSRLRLS